MPVNLLRDNAVVSSFTKDGERYEIHRVAYDDFELGDFTYELWGAIAGAIMGRLTGFLDYIFSTRILELEKALREERYRSLERAIGEAAIESFLKAPPLGVVSRLAALERENAELLTLFQRATEYLEELADAAANDRSSIDVAGILDFVKLLRDDYEHKITKPEEPR